MQPPSKLVYANPGWTQRDRQIYYYTPQGTELHGLRYRWFQELELAGSRKKLADPELLAELLPATVKIHFYQCFSDASVSEQVARMVAMKAATDAAEDMIKRLTQQYNRARQTAITMELLDIVGGASALE